jgi:tetratricopeptide (TPR) repeat protein
LVKVFQELGRVHQRAQRSEKALEVWRRLEEQFPGDVRVGEQIAITLADEGQLDQALARYEALVKNSPDPRRRPLFRMEAAELKARLGRRSAAVADYEALLRDLPPEDWLSRQAEQKLEDVFLRTEDLAGLAKYYQDVLDREPGKVRAMERLARVLNLQGRAPDSQAWLLKALARAPSRTELRLALIEQWTLEGKFAQAIAQYEEIDKYDPNHPDYLREWGRLLLKDTARPEAERIAQAAAIWRRLLPAKGRRPDPTVTAQVADLFRQAGLTDEALALYRQAVEQSPEQATYRVFLGEHLNSLGRTEEALAAWSEIAKGSRRTATNLQQLAQVLSDFGYRKQAVVNIAAACALEPRDLGLSLQHADFLYQDQRYAEALAVLQQASQLAGDDLEQQERVLQAQLKNHQGAGTLLTEAESQSRELAAAAKATAWRWYRLARYREMGRQWPEAVAAIQKSLALGENSREARIYAWTAAIRMHEGAGNLQAAANACRQLATLDRAGQAEYLRQAATLEAKLGRRAEALQAGRDLLAASPGVVDHYRFFADLCFQLGEATEGLETLRRAVRVNQGDPEALMALGRALADQFRTEEAIELYWRAFARYESLADLDGRLALVPRLTELYLRGNQFDRLLERFQRQRREPEKRREMSLCLTAAYKAAGDLGTARQELERLLALNAQDTAILQQLSFLAENESQLEAAVKYQRQLAKLSSSPEARNRLAILLLHADAVEEATGIWQQLANDEKQPQRLLQMIDNVLLFGRHERALPLLERILRERPKDWEALYREGFALVGLEKYADAARRFQAILELRLPDEKLSVLLQPDSGTKATRAGSRPAKLAELPLQDRLDRAYQIRLETGLQRRPSSQRDLWTPADFGQARMAALAWLYALAQKEHKQKEFVDRQRVALGKAGSDSRGLWDWWYLNYAIGDMGAAYEASKILARSSDLAAQWLYLSSLQYRPERLQAQPRRFGEKVTPPPALAAAELDHLSTCYHNLEHQQPHWLNRTVFDNVTQELKLAKRDQESEQIYRAAVRTASEQDWVSALLEAAARRGDTEGAFQLFDRFARLPRTNTLTTRGRSPTEPQEATVALAHLMKVRADAKAYEDVLRVLEHFFTFRREQLAKRVPLSLSAPGSTFTGTYRASLDYNGQLLTIQFPRERSEYLDENTLLLLRQALDIYQRADLVTDLYGYWSSQIKQKSGTDRAFAHLALACLYWWSEDRDAALQEWNLACKDDPANLFLQVQLAMALEDNGQFQEALTHLDAIPAFDQTLMQRREQEAMRLAVKLGDVKRARTAAERLFGLRLDASIQILVAGQMQQLGMHELAEAVLGRARSQAGNKIEVLVSLMQEYQAQNQLDRAAQVAFQVLRLVPRVAPTTRSRLRSRTEQDSDPRAVALQLLRQTGKLAELTQRVEAQLNSSPKSSQLLQTLADYYQAAGERAKAAAVYQRLVELKPRDAQLRFQIAGLLLELGDPKAAVEQYTLAVRRDPSLLGQNAFELQNAFRRANQREALGQLLAEIDLKAMGDGRRIGYLIRDLLAADASRALGWQVMHKAWNLFPEDRIQLLSGLDSQQIWNLPEVYDYAKQALVTHRAPANYAWQQETSLLALVNIAERQGKLEVLLRETQDELRRATDWNSGKLLDGLINAQLRNYAAAQKALADWLATEQSSMSSWIAEPLGRELDKHPPLRELAMKVFQAKVDDLIGQIGFETQISLGTMSQHGGGSLDWNRTPIGRLVTHYRATQRNMQAREVCLRFLQARLDGSSFNDSYRLQGMLGAGEQLLQMGYTIDALRMFHEVANNIQVARDNYSEADIRERIERGLRQAAEAAHPEQLLNFFQDAIKSRPEKTEGATIDLLLQIVQPQNLDQIKLLSLTASALRSAAGQPETAARVRRTLDQVRQKFPRDFAVLTADVLFALGEDSQSPVTAALTRLTQLVVETPLDNLPPNARANARQRADAARQLCLWLAARECDRLPALRATAAPLAERALEAARRQSDQRYLLAMLREAGQLALDRCEPGTAEQHWGEMLNLIVLPSRPATAMPAVKRPLRPSLPSVKSAAILVTTDQFAQAAQLAKLAGEHCLHNLSLRAVSLALQGGPPVEVQPTQARQLPQRFSRSKPGVVDKLDELVLLWERTNAPAPAVYEALASCMMPAHRPGEVFLFTNTQPEDPFDFPSRQQFRSAADHLVRWAVQAGQVEDLRRRLQARLGQPLAELPARVLLARLGLESKNYAVTEEALDWLARRLQKDNLRNTAELAHYAALPALQVPALSRPAAVVLGRVAQPLGGPVGKEPGLSVYLTLARHYFAAKDLESGQKYLQQYAQSGSQSGSRSNFSVLYSLKNRLGTVTRECLAAGLRQEAWDYFGRLVDLASAEQEDWSLRSLLPTLLHNLGGLPATERYALLKRWTLPSDNRKGARLFALSNTSWYGYQPEGANSQPLFSSAALLLDVAREAGKLDELAAELEPLAQRHADNAESLLLLTRIAAGDWTRAEPAVRQLLDVAPARSKRPSQPVPRVPVSRVVQTFDWNTLLIARACLHEPRLRPLGEQLVLERLHNSTAQSILGQELENAPEFQTFVQRIYEAGVDLALAQEDAEFVQQIVPRLSRIYHRAGRAQDARALVMRFVESYKKPAAGNQSWQEQQRLQKLIDLGNQLLAGNYPLDAARQFHFVLSHPSLPHTEYIRSNAREGLASVEKRFTGETLALSLKDLVSLKSDLRNQAGALDFLLFVKEDNLDRINLNSPIAEVLHQAAGTARLLATTRAGLESLVKQFPSDLTVQTGLTLLAVAEGKPESVEAAVRRLAELAAQSKPTASPQGQTVEGPQPDEPQLCLWLVWRRCAANSRLRELGANLRTLALEAARRRADNNFLLAMLREDAQLALERGDSADAAACLGEMLTSVLPTAGSGPVLVSQFDHACQIARLAAEHKFSALSLRAIRLALGHGPPNQDPNPNGGFYSAPDAGDSATDRVAQEVENRLAELALLWRQTGVPATEVYDTLADVVLPQNRSLNAVVYTRTLTPPDASHPRSVGSLLVDWAVRAGRQDDLRKRLLALVAQAPTSPEAHLLQTQLGLAVQQRDLAQAALRWFDRRLQNDAQARFLELACHAALPALAVPQLAPQAQKVLHRAARAQGGIAGEETLRGLYVALARFHATAGEASESHKVLQEYAKTNYRRTANYQGVIEVDDPPRASPANPRQLTIATELTRAGLSQEAWDALGQIADSGTPPLSDAAFSEVVCRLASQLGKQSAPDRYARLKDWMLPSAQHRTVRMVTCLAPAETPPAAFGVPPLPVRSDVLSLAEVLVDAARSIGKLDELARELEPAVNDKVPRASILLTLLQIARGEGAGREARLEQMALELAKKHPPRHSLADLVPEWSGVSHNSIDVNDYLVARSCLADPRLRPLGERMLGSLMNAATAEQDNSWIHVLRLDQARSALASAGPQATIAALTPEPSLWHSAAPSAGSFSTNLAAPLWIEQEGHLCHLSGGFQDNLYLTLPLAGSFDFAVDVYYDQGWDGAIGYGGRFLGSAPSGQEATTSGPNLATAQANVSLQKQTFHRLTLQVRPGLLRYLVDGRFWQEDRTPSSASPWLVLQVPGNKRGLFRNLTLDGTPTLMREVALVEGDRLEGWTASLYHEARSYQESGRFYTRRGWPVVEVDAGKRDWSAKASVVQSRRLDSDVRPAPVPSHLAYQRPLRAGESVAYEFYYEPGSSMVYPALGRLVFLLEPDGVRLHWLTSSPDEWTGLAVGNTVKGPAGPRAPARLSLQPAAWNALKMTLTERAVTLELNGTTVYECPLDAEANRTFGLFHFKDQTRAEVRRLMLRGDWHLPELQPGWLTRRKQTAAPAVARARQMLIGEEYLSLNSLACLKKARNLAAAERLEVLADWILPCSEHEHFRLSGTISTKPAGKSSTPRPRPIGKLEVPAFELVAAAKESGKLKELRDRIEKLPTAPGFDERSKVALLALVLMTAQQDAEAGVLLRKLTQLSAGLPPTVSEYEQWPDLVTAAQALNRPGLDRMAGPLCELLQSRLRYRRVSPEWAELVRSLGEPSR